MNRSTRTNHAARTRTRRGVARAALGLVAAGTVLGVAAPMASAASTTTSSDRAIIAVAPNACDGSVKPGERAGIIAVRPGERAGIIAVVPAPSCPG